MSTEPQLNLVHDDPPVAVPISTGSAVADPGVVSDAEKYKAPLSPKRCLHRKLDAYTWLCGCHVATCECGHTEKVATCPLH